MPKSGEFNVSSRRRSDEFDVMLLLVASSFLFGLREAVSQTAHSHCQNTEFLRKKTARLLIMYSLYVHSLLDHLDRTNSWW